MTNPAYNPQKYWQARGQHYHGETDGNEINWLCKFVQDNISYDDSICEIGSGYGRVYAELEKRQLISDVRFVMFDFVQSMRQRCYDLTGILPAEWNGQHIPREDNTYTLVISVNVLLHVPPGDIRQLFAEHIRVANKYLYIATYTGSGEGLSNHCFSHDYDRLFTWNGLRVVDSRVFNDIRTSWVLEV